MEKRELFDEDNMKELSRKFKILSESSRLKIIRILFEEEKCVNDIVQSSGLLQSNVSKQLKILQSAGILSCRQSGLQRYYTVKDKTIYEICTILCSTQKNDFVIPYNENS